MGKKTKLLKQHIGKEIKAPKDYAFALGTWVRVKTVKLVPIFKILPDGTGFTLEDRIFKTSGLSTIRKLSEIEVNLERKTKDSYGNNSLTIDTWRLEQEEFYPKEWYREAAKESKEPTE